MSESFAVLAVAIVVAVYWCCSKCYRWCCGPKPDTQTEEEVYYSDKFRLPNGIDVLMIRNDKFTDSVVSVKADVGNFYDPKDTPGLANLVAECIGHGSSRYPGNYFFDLVKLKNGKFTKFLGENEIKFMVQIPDENLAEIMEVLAWSIASPKFTKELITEHIKTIDDEYHKDRTNLSTYSSENILVKVALDDSCLEKNLCYGNKETLTKSDIENKVKEFHSENYTADRIKLVICSKLKMNVLRNVASSFNVLKQIDGPSKSLLSTPIKVKFSDKFAYSLVKYKTSDKADVLSLRMNLPPICPVFKHGFGSFTIMFLIIKVILLSDKERGFDRYFTSDIIVMYRFLDRYTSIGLEYKLSPFGKANISKLLKEIKCCLENVNLTPELFNKTLSLFQTIPAAGSTSFQAALFFSEPQYFEYFNYDPKYRHDLFSKIYDAVKDKNNWLFLLSTYDDTDLTNLEEHSLIKYSDPIPIDAVIENRVDPKNTTTGCKHS